MSDKEIAIREEQEVNVKSNIDIGALVTSVGQIDITDEQREILFAPVDEDKIEMRPDGLIYLPWVFYTERLNKAFPMQWAIIPKGEAKYLEDEKLMMREYLLIIKGSLMATAVGEQNYYANNKTMSYTDAIEGTKSNALMRCCKAIGISNELWQPEFIKNWKAKHGKSNEFRKKTPLTKPVKSKSYIEIEDDIVSYLNAPHFTGELTFNGKLYNLDEFRKEQIALLNNEVYHMKNLKKLHEGIKRMAELAEIRQPPEVEKELSDDELFDINEKEGNLSQ